MIPTVEEETTNDVVETPTEEVEEAVEEVTEEVETAEQPEEVLETTEEPTEPELYDLPDGRKVDGSTLAREWKENFMPDYTKKSQELSQYKEINKPDEAPEEWQPQSYEEIVQRAKQEMKDESQRESQEREQATQELESKIESDLAEIKKADPNLNEDTLYAHATKYGFQDLKVAHSNLRDMQKMVQSTKSVTAKKVAERANNPVATKPNGSNVDAGLPQPSQFDSAVEYLRALKKN